MAGRFSFENVRLYQDYRTTAKNTFIDVPVDFPAPPINAVANHWPRAVVPKNVISAARRGTLQLPLKAIQKQPLTVHDERELWAAAVAGTDSLANAALDRLCLTLGAVTGDMALAQGATAVVIGGGVGQRIADYLPHSGFRGRFIAKGRFERRMDEMPVKLITYPEPGLFGAAAAFAREHP